MTPILQYQGELYQFLRQFALMLNPYANVLWRASAVAYLAFLTFAALEMPSRRRIGECMFITVLLSGMALLRLPGLLFPDLNPDEGQWLASAGTLIADPRFWISVDGTTSGPLNVYPLTLPYFLGLSLDYATLRLVGLLLGWVPALGFLYGAFKTQFAETTARLAVLPAAVALTFMQVGDGVAYNSEHFPSALLALGLFLLIRLRRNPPTRWNVLAPGFVLGCVPYTKLQAVPIALFLAGVGLLLLLKQRKTILHYFIGGLLPTALVLLYVWLADGFDFFYHSFILANLGYAQTGSFGHGVESWPEKLTYLLPLIYTGLPSTRMFYTLLPLLILLGIGLCLPKNQPLPMRWAFGLSAVWLGVAVYATLQTGNRFFHYQLVAFVPAFWLAGVVLVLALRISRGAVLLAAVGVWLALLVLWPGLTFAWNGHDMLSMLRGGQTTPLAQPNLVAAIRAQSRPNEKMVVWGWLNRLHVETGLLMGSRFIPLYYPVVPGELQPYFMRLHEADIRRNRPRIFVDTTPLFPAYADFTPDRYPGIVQLLREEYRFVGEFDGARLYVRK